MSLLSRIARTRIAVLTLAIGAAALTAVASPAMAATSPTAHARPSAVSALGSLPRPDIPANGTFNIVNNNSRRCIGIDTSGYAGIWNCTSNRDQTWQWQDVFSDSSGTLWGQLVNGNNMCLGVSAGSTSQGARIRDWTCQPGVANQYWSSTMNPPYLTNLGGFEVNGNTGASIAGVQGGSTANGAHIVLWTPLGNADQAWS